MPGKNLISQELRKIKDKHGVTQEMWSKMSGVPASSVARYLSSSLNIPNYPYVCAMLRCLGESSDAFYDRINERIDAPEQALKLDAVPVAVVGDVVVDTPEEAAAIQERIIVQTEAMQQQKATIREHEATIELMNARLEMMEQILEEKERTISNLEDINRRRLQALQALCSAQ